MSPTPPRPSSIFSVWLIVGCGVGWLLWNNHTRMAHIRQITDLPTWSVNASEVSDESPTGYAQGRRRLILPESDHAGGLQIIRAQRVLAEGAWIQRRVDFENAPHGRDSHHASPGSWWLALLAKLDRVLTGTPAGIAVERAALYADPLQLVLLLGVLWPVAVRMGGVTGAALTGLAVATVFPFAGNFLAGSVGRPTGLLAVNMLGLLLLTAGLREESGPNIRRRNGYFALAGVLGGLGLWLGATVQSVMFGGVLLGGLGLRVARGQGAGTSTAWRIFGLSGAAVSMSAYWFEYAGTDFTWRLEANHPLYALAWLGGAEMLAQLSVKPADQATGWQRFAGWLWSGASVLALGAVYVGSESLPPWQLDPQSTRLSGLLGISEENLWQWLRHDGVSLPVVATLWPVLVLVVASGLTWRQQRRQAGGTIPEIWLIAGPAVLLLVLSGWQLSWWNWWSVAALALFAGLWLSPTNLNRGPVIWLLLALAPGWICLWQRPLQAGNPKLTESEWISLMERDLAYWLKTHGPTEGVRVLAPPTLTATLHYYADLTGLGTFAWENQDGLNVAARIASAGTPDEAQELMAGRGVTHIVIPTWDDFLDHYAGLGRGNATKGAANNTFVAALHRWEQPAWLWPRAYPIPSIEGSNGREVRVFSVGDAQDAPAAMSRMAEYFVETGQLELADRARQVLRQHPGHLGALVATAMVDAAHRDAAAFQATMNRLQPLLAAGGDRTLPWDRRLSLAVVLATAKQGEAASTQLQRCLRETSEPKLRALPAQSLRQLLTLQERMQLQFPTTELDRLARQLLPMMAREP